MCQFVIQASAKIHVFGKLHSCSLIFNDLGVWYIAYSWYYPGRLQEFCPKKIQKILKIKVSLRKIISTQKCSLSILVSNFKRVPPQRFLVLKILLKTICWLENFCPIRNAYLLPIFQLKSHMLKWKKWSFWPKFTTFLKKLTFFISILQSQTGFYQDKYEIWVLTNLGNL